MKRVVKSLGLIILIICIANCNYIKALAIDNQWNFELTKTTEVFTVPQTGLYRIETMGATGYNRDNGHADDGSPGFATYELVLKQGEQLYITVGGKGSLSTDGTVAGGFNGGGSASGAGNGSGGGATLVAFKPGTIATLTDSDILSVAGGSGGMSSYEPASWGECVNIGAQGGGYYGGSRDYAQGGTQTTGYSKGTGQSGVNCGGAGGGYYGGYASGSPKWGAGGGSGYLNTERLTYQAIGSLVDINNQNGYVRIKLLGAAKSTVTIELGGNGKINGQSSITYTGNYGDTITLPSPTLQYNYVTFKGYKNLSTGNCGTINGLTFTFGLDKTFLVAEYGGTKATLETTQNGNKVSAKVTFSAAEYAIFNLMGGKSPSNLTDTLTSYTAVPLDAFKTSMTVSLTGYKSQAVTVNFNGYYDITMLSGGGGDDHYYGGSGATLGLRCYLYKGDVVTLYGSSGGEDHVSGRKTDPGGKGIANGGNGYASGGGGGASGFTLNGTVAAAAGAGGGDNWSPGYGGRVLGSTGHTNGSSMNGQNGHCIDSDGSDAADTGGGGAGWYGGAEGAGDGVGGAWGGISGYNASLLRNPTVIANQGGESNKPRHDGWIKMVPYSFDVPSGLSGSGDTYTVTIKDTVAPDSPIHSRIESFTENGYTIKLVKTVDPGGYYYMQIPGYTDIKSFFYTSGFYGWRYNINTSASYVISSADTLTQNATLNIGLENEGKYLHVAAVDGDGNISDTYTLKLPQSIYVSYNINATQHNPSTATTGNQNAVRIYENSALQVSDTNLNTNGQTPVRRVGYNCTHWNTKADGTGINFQFNQIADYTYLKSIGTNIVLYAQWEPIKYNVVFHGNDNWNTSQGTYRQTLTFDKPENLIANKFTRTAPYNWNNIQINKSYNYMGWGLTNKQTAVNFTDKQQVLNLRNTEGDYNIYAIWRRPLKLTFNLNGGNYMTSTNNIVLSSYVYNSQKHFNFNITNGTVIAVDGVQSAQTNQIDAYGTYNLNGENSKYTKVDSNGTTYRFLGWSLNPNATEPDRDFDVFNPNRKTTYTIYNDTTLYAVWEPVLQANFEIDRTLGNITFNDGTKPVTNLPALNSSKGEQTMSVIIRPGEQGFYKIDSTGSNNLTFKIAFDTRITDIYTHGDSDSEWRDELNPSTHEDFQSGQGHGLNRQITGVKNFTRKFHIPQYLGTDRSYDTSNPDKTNVPINKYVAVAVLSQPSYYHNTVYGTDEQIIVNINIYISPNNSSDFNNVEDKLPSIISEIRTRIL